MIHFLKQKNVFSSLEKYVQTSNFRKEYYLEKKLFYDDLVEKKIFQKLSKINKTILYAPTWADAESSSSFAEGVSYLIEHLPTHLNLIIKPHPNLLLDSSGKNQEILTFYQNTPRVLFLSDFPPIYPLLAITDYYVGDFSSIGYDFLFFNKPLFFLNQKKREAQKDQGLYLFRCGIEVQPENYKDLYSIIEKSSKNHSSLLCKETYEYTFGDKINLSSLKETIEETFNLQRFSKNNEKPLS